MPTWPGSVRRIQQRVVDVLAVLLAASCVVRAVVEPLSPVLPVAALSAMICLPLLLRERFPMAAPMVGLAALIAVEAVRPGTVGNQMQVFLSAMLVFWAIGSSNELRVALSGLAVGLLVFLIGTAVDPEAGAGDFAFSAAVFTGCWGAGHAFRRRTSEAALWRTEAETRELKAAAELAEERARISRDMHDVVAHSVGLIVVQLGAADRVLDRDPAAARTAVRAARDIGKQALTDLRGVLALLGPDSEDPSKAGLFRAPALLTAFRQAGLDVTFRSEGEGVLPPAVDQTAYRLLQESLTNALKHARTPSADVEVRWASDTWRMIVRNPAGEPDTGPARPELPGAGRGIAGMRERVRLHGGEFSACRHGDEFVVDACLPRSSTR